MTATAPFPLTWLYVPGDRPHVVIKALASGADVVVIDLEDAVAPDRKEYARAATAELLTEPPPVPVHVRVNALDGPLVAADLAAVAPRPGLAGLRLPKVTSAEQVIRIAELTEAGEPRLRQGGGYRGYAGGGARERSGTVGDGQAPEGGGGCHSAAADERHGAARDCRCAAGGGRGAAGCWSAADGGRGTVECWCGAGRGHGAAECRCVADERPGTAGCRCAAARGHGRADCRCRAGEEPEAGCRCAADRRRAPADCRCVAGTAGAGEEPGAAGCVCAAGRERSYAGCPGAAGRERGSAGCSCAVDRERGPARCRCAGGEGPGTTAGVLSVLEGDAAHGTGPPLYALLENALAVEQAYVIASAHPSLRGVSIGEADLRADLGVRQDTGLDWCRARVVVAARAAGLAPPAQSVHPDIRDLEGLAASCAHGRALGFLGRAAIHPRQLPIIERAYLPTDRELEEAETVVKAATMDRGAQALADGRFIDAAVVAAARRTLALARRY